MQCALLLVIIRLNNNESNDIELAKKLESITNIRGLDTLLRYASSFTYFT